VRSLTRGWHRGHDRGVQHALYLPVFGEFADAARLAAIASEAEEAGWDGVFIWEHLAMWWDRALPVVDTTVALTAISVATERIRFGALVTPLARRRPAKLAREMVSIDHLSSGRLMVGVGLGSNEHEFEALGEESDMRTRGEMLDEALEVVTGLWSGEEIAHRGIHYRAGGCFLPRPVQEPRIPIWVAGS